MACWASFPIKRSRPLPSATKATRALVRLQVARIRAACDACMRRVLLGGQDGFMYVFVDGAAKKKFPIDDGVRRERRGWVS